MNFLIYKITNLVNGKIYIGQTIKTLEQRKAAHINSARNGGRSAIHRAIRKYGIDNLAFEKLCSCLSKRDMNQKEIDIIKTMKSKSLIGYNMTDGGEGTLGWKPTGETRAKMSKSHIGNISALGFKHSNETKANVSKSHMGNTNNLGNKASDETKAKQSKARKGRKNSSETNAKQSKRMMGNTINLGRKRSAEAIIKTSKANKGKKRSDEARANISMGWEKRKLKPFTVETRAKMSAAGILRWQRKREMADRVTV